MAVFFSQGQRLRIRGVDYTVEGAIWFDEDGWQWQEYKLRSIYGEENWLGVEDDDGITLCSMYTMTADRNPSEEYSLDESGTARVVRAFGDVDVDIGERVRYKEYVNYDRTKFFSVEKWSDEQEYSYGYRLYQEDIQVYEMDDTYKSKESHPVTPKVGRGGVLSKFLWIGIAIVFFCAPILDGVYSTFIGSTHIIEDFLEKNSSFQYVTSVTSNVNSNKAKVYSTELSVDEAVRAIIVGTEGELDQISTEDETSDSTDEKEDGVGLNTGKEYAYVYSSTDNLTYIQVSSAKFMTEEQGDAYHSRYHTHHYSRMFRSKRSNSSYSSLASSTRQAVSARRSSTRTRSSSGGGISHGK